MGTTFDSTYIIRKEKYDEFVADAEKQAIAVYTRPAFIWPELYRMVDMESKKKEAAVIGKVKQK